MNSFLKKKQIYSKYNNSTLKIPNHVAIIMDGNGRWAKDRGKKRIAGHSEGVKTIQPIMDMAKELGVSYLTLWAFSVDNWKRPKYEVNFLMKLLEKYIADEKDRLVKNKIRLRVIGNIEDLPLAVRKKLTLLIEETKGFDNFNLNIALSYGGREELINALKKISSAVQMGKIRVDDIDSGVISSSLLTSDIPDPDLIIRTSGEIRLSNFFVWQSAYSEFYFSSVLWPDFKPEHFIEAIAHYTQRDRRFGGVHP